MGQIIEVKSTKLNKTIIFDLNRSVSGQEGMTFHNISEASLIPDVSGQLALKLFQETSDIETISRAPIVLVKWGRLSPSSIFASMLKFI